MAFIFISHDYFHLITLMCIFLHYFLASKSDCDLFGRCYVQPYIDYVCITITLLCNSNIKDYYLLHKIKRRHFMPIGNLGHNPNVNN